MVLDLNNGWQLKHKPLKWTAQWSALVLKETEDWIDCDLPCDVHIPLIREGVIKEPLTAVNFKDCRWIETRSWWFRKTFILSSEILCSDRLQINIEGIDCNSDIFVNGSHIGCHRNAFYPFTEELKGYLTEGENTILVRLTTGLDDIRESDLNILNHRKLNGYNKVRDRDRLDERRVMIRKPQYVVGWDWGPKLITCGIAGNVWIDAEDELKIISVHARTLSLDPARVAVTVESENFMPISTLPAELSIEIFLDGRKISEKRSEAILCSGINYSDFIFIIDDPQLWWPNGSGNQPLYKVITTIKTTKSSVSHETSFGIRTVSLDMSVISEEENPFSFVICGKEIFNYNSQDRRFVFKINGKRIFMKGGNWVPADSIYCRVTDEKYCELIEEAVTANFNMLRVWGGGIYEREVFYRKCDESGIMVWQDFMFSGSFYPDDQDYFRDLCRNEFTYQIRRLRNHPSMVLWCGNNESHHDMTYHIRRLKGNRSILNLNPGKQDWSNDPEGVFGGIYLYNHLAPSIVRNISPEIPYWNASPYGGAYPQDDSFGDKHHWHECMFSGNMEDRITPEQFDNTRAKFVSEYGYPGPCVIESIRDYFGDEVIDRDSSIWFEHTNTLEKETVLAGINKHYIDADNLSLDQYIFYASLCHGLMLGYSLEALRFKQQCWGALFWMYNDAWGEIGWTIVDYYLRRKPSYYYVKRALEPIKLILRNQGNSAVLTVINDTQNEKIADIEYGWISYDGKEKRTQICKSVIPALSREVLLTFPLNANEEGSTFARFTEQNEAPSILREHPFRNLSAPNAQVHIENVRISNNKYEITISADTFAHAVHLEVPGDARLSDNYFDMLPGDRRIVTLSDVTLEISDLVLKALPSMAN